MDNLGAVLTAAGMTFDNGVMATCFLKDLNDFPKFNETYATYFKDNMPPGMRRCRWRASRGMCSSRSHLSQ